MKTPKDIMEKFKFFPDTQDGDAAYAAMERFFSRLRESEFPDIDDSSLFASAFYRGCFWMQEKHKELLHILGTEDLELAKKRARKLVELKKRDSK